MIKNKTLKEVHNYFIEILGFDEKSSEIKSNLQKNKEYDELDRFFKLPQCHQNNENAHKTKADTNETLLIPVYEIYEL
jgi:type III secretory pathway component EscR